MEADPRFVIRQYCLQQLAKMDEWKHLVRKQEDDDDVAMIDGISLEPVHAGREHELLAANEAVVGEKRRRSTRSRR